MKVFFALLIAMAGALSPPPSRSADVVALVDLKFIEETDIPAGMICFGEDQCDVWAVHYLWEARVRELIHGEEIDRRFRVLFGRHALVKRDLKKRYVALRRLTPEEHPTARYEVIDTGYQRTFLCFSGPMQIESPVLLKEARRREQRCFPIGEAEDG